MKNCYNCDKKIKSLNSKPFDCQDYCIPCFDQLIFKCSNCSIYSLKDNSYLDPDDTTICEDCYSDNCFLCDDCGNVKWTDDAHSFESSLYCDDCIGNIAFECYNCSSLFHNDGRCYCESCNEDYCNDCYSDDSCRSDNYQEQDLQFQEGKKSSLITVDRFVGAELEAENGNRSDLNLPYTFGIKDDGSLDDDTGVEIVIPPSKDGALVKNIKLACEQLNKCGFESTSHCGLHIHIDLRDIRNDYIKLSRIMRTFFAVEDVMFAMLPDSRLASSYCYPLRKYYSFYDFYGRKVLKQFDCTIYETENKYEIAQMKKDHGISKRYRACNFHSVFYRGTLEVRSHSGSQNPAKILKWIELLLKITDWSINHYRHSQVEDLLKMDASSRKVRKMFKIFKFSKKVEQHINSRMRHFKHNGLHIDYTLGQLPKRKRK